MAKSSATTVEAYLRELPAERRAVMSAVRDLIRQNLPSGYCETMNWGMINYEIPLSRYPTTYNGRPLCYIGLAAQKNNYSLYLMCVYMNPKLEARLKAGFAQIGKKPDMGKSCVRFKTLEDLPLEVIGELVASTTPAAYIQRYEASRAPTKARTPLRRRV
jgi:hypothetical protein